MISIHNTQRLFPVDEKEITRQVHAMLSFLGYEAFDVGILFCGTSRMKNYNRTYRGKDKVTDILSFPFDDDRDPTQPLLAETPEEQQLGDLIICPQYVATTCGDFERDYHTHLTALLAHGIAHLLGHDHIKDDEYARMNALEQQLIKKAS